MSSSLEFWKEIETEFSFWQDWLQGLRLGNKDDKTEYYAARINLNIEPILTSNNANGTVLYPKSLDKEYTGLLTEAFRILGLPVPKEHISHTTPDYMDQDGNIIESIQTAIEIKETSSSFARAWAKYNHATGIVLSCILLDKSATDYFRQYIIKATPPHLIENHIYSYWMLPRWAEQKKGKDVRKDAEEELASRISNYIENLEDGDLKQRLENMIEDEQHLKGRIITLTKDDVRKIVSRNLIPKDLLPDLGYDS